MIEQLERVEFHVVTPSYRRPTDVKAAYLVRGMKIVVRPEEEAVYRENYPDVELVVMDRGVTGLSNTRQWIYEHFGNVFMVDDDVVRVSRLYMIDKAPPELTPDEAYELIQYTGNMARAAGCYLFGFNPNPSSLIYNPFNPIRLSGYIPGYSLGLVKGSKLYFDPTFVSTDDYFISALNAYHHRMCWKDTRFCFEPKDNFEKAGGVAAYRTMDTEKQDTLNLARMFGDVVRLKGVTGMGKKGANRVAGIEYSRTLQIPF